MKDNHENAARSSNQQTCIAQDQKATFHKLTAGPQRRLHKPSENPTKLEKEKRDDVKL